MIFTIWKKKEICSHAYFFNFSALVTHQLIHTVKSYDCKLTVVFSTVTVDSCVPYITLYFNKGLTVSSRIYCKSTS